MWRVCLIVPVFLAFVLMSACGRLLPQKTGELPCDGVDRGLMDARKSALASVLAGQLHASTVDVRDSLSASGWNIVYVDTHEADEAFLFFSGDPLRAITLLSGAAVRPRMRNKRLETGR